MWFKQKFNTVPNNSISPSRKAHQHSDHDETILKKLRRCSGNENSSTYYLMMVHHETKLYIIVQITDWEFPAKFKKSQGTSGSIFL